MNIEFNCSECGQLLAIDSKYAGAKVECPKCNAEMQVPESKLVSKPVGSEKGTDIPEEEKLRLEAQQEAKKELENKKQEKKREKLTKADYLSTTMGCFITFFCTIIIVHLIKQESSPSILFVVGEAMVPAGIAVIISLASRRPFVGIGIMSFLFVKGSFYAVLRDIYGWVPTQAGRFSTLAFVIVTLVGAGMCWLIKKIVLTTQGQR